MKGTEKQIAWATEILNRINPGMEKALTLVNPANRENWEDMFTRVRNADAYKIIDCFKQYVATGDEMKDAANIVKAIGAYQKLSEKACRF